MDNQDAILAIEEEAVKAVASGWRTDVEAFKEAVIKLSATVDGHDMSAIIPQLTMMLAKLSPSGNMDRLAAEGVAAAHEFGVGTVADAVSSPVPKVSVSQDAVKAVTGLDALVSEAISLAHRNLLGSDFSTGGMGALLAALQPVTASANKVEVAAAWSINTASNEAVYETAKKLKETTTWISERDACVDCQSFNGVTNTGEGFEADINFGVDVSGRKDFPPLHPRCRCAIEVGITEEYAQALKREAVRSILRGIKTDSESEKVRIDAAARLLETHPDGVPATVMKYAEKSIKNGSFQ